MPREMNNYSTNVQAVAGLTEDGKPVALLVEDDGTLKTSGGGGGDASAANQTLQLAEATDTNANLGDPASPKNSNPDADASINSNLKGVLERLLDVENWVKDVHDVVDATQQMQFGFSGSDTIKNESASHPTSGWIAIYADTDVTISAITLVSGATTGASNLVGTVIPAGTTKILSIAAIEIVGTATLYNPSI